MDCRLGNCLTRLGSANLLRWYFFPIRCVGAEAGSLILCQWRDLQLEGVPRKASLLMQQLGIVRNVGTVCRKKQKCRNHSTAVSKSVSSLSS